MAPSPWVRMERFREVESQAAQYRGYRQECRQLSAGAFEGSVTSFDFGADFVVQLETVNQEIALARHRLAGRWGVCILADASSPPCKLNGVTLGRDHLLVCPEGNALFGKTPAGARVYCMDVSRELVLDETAAYNSVELIYDCPAVQSLRELLDSGFATVRHLQAPEQDFPVAKAFKLAITDALCRVDWEQRTAEARSGARDARRRSLRLFRLAREFIDHHLAEGVSVAEICKYSGASRRSLERVFRSMLGMGPNAYMRNLQLNRVRRDLLSAVADDISIRDIVARHGVWHWSRFSHSYRLLFGELPSQTRTRRLRRLM